MSFNFLVQLKNLDDTASQALTAESGEDASGRSIVLNPEAGKHKSDDCINKKHRNREHNVTR